MTDEVARVDIRISVHNQRLRKFLAQFKKGERNRWCEDALTLSMDKNNLNALTIKKSELERELKRINSLINFSDKFKQDEVKEMLNIASEPNAQSYFVEYKRKLRPEFPYEDGRTPEQVANTWLADRIYDFQIETNQQVTMEQFKLIFAEWEELKL